MGYFNTTTTSSQSQTGNRVATTYHQTGREWDPGWDKGPVLWRWVDRTWTEYSWVPYTFTPAKTKKELKIVGLKNAYLQPSSTPYGMTLKKFDTASYVDRAILQLKNETAGNVVVRDISIRGEPVYQIAGQNGFIWEYSDYDSIDKNGEQFKEIGNDFIFDAGQAESIGDFAWKLLKPHQVYTLALRGCQYQYQIGDVYTLNIDYSLDASSSQIELVNVDVEIIGISFERSVGSVGSTMLACRVDLGAWSKTTSRRAQLVGTGQANNNTNRATTVVVASSTYTGTADYYCDNATDNTTVLQKAIDDLYAIGGGDIILTDGTFYIPSSPITVKDNVSISGSGASTTVYLGFTAAIRISGKKCTIKNINFTSGVAGGSIYSVVYGGKEFVIESCYFSGYTEAFIEGRGKIVACSFVDNSACRLYGDSACTSSTFNTAAEVPIEIATNGNNIVSNNIITMKNGNQVCIRVAANNSVISNNQITASTVNTANEYTAIGASTVLNPVISGNQIYGVVNSGSGTGYGIRIGAATRANVCGNTALGCDNNYINGGTGTVATGNIFA